eukprot:GHVL01043372.1.p1 GENE.GHVL01043372.1~~GHVL01043372.1.p1  ORF type:complete len:177 (+),score=8.35 GHVL01043372.1:13-543(+)
MSIIGRFRVYVTAAQAKPSPQLGQVLGPLGVNMLVFCKEFNARTSKVRADVPLQVTIVPSTDGSYKFFMRAPNMTWFLLRNARMFKGDMAKYIIRGYITNRDVYNIAKAKCMDPTLIGTPDKFICRSIVSTAATMGIKVARKLRGRFLLRDDTPPNILASMKAIYRASRKGISRKP